MPDKPSTDRRLVVTVGIALILLFVALYLWAAQSRQTSRYEGELQSLAEQVQVAERQFEEQVALTGSVDELTRQQEILTDETMRLAADRDTRQGELDELQASVAAASEELAQTLEERDRTQAETEALRQEAAPLREEIDQFETRRAELETEIVTQTEELSNIGTRLEEARASEADLTATIAALAEDQARLSKEARDAEERLQSALAEEADAREQAAAMTDEVMLLEDRRDTLTSEVADLENRRGIVADSLAEAEAQRADIQAIVTALTQEVESRAARLAEIEERIGELMSAEGARPAAADAEGSGEDGSADARGVSAQSLRPGRYGTGDIELIFTPEGELTVRGGVEDGATGQWRIEEGILVVEVEGAAPLRCAFIEEEGGFMTRHRDDGACLAWDGVMFQRLDSTN